MTVETFSATGLLILFVTFAAVALAAMVAVLVWAARTKQFSNQDEARYLPLKSGIPKPATSKTEGTRIARTDE
jgi:nitrogen fixation-related uncharacterized protein